MVNLDNPDWLTRQLMKVDPAIFYGIMRLCKLGLLVLDWTLDKVTGYSLTEGSQIERQEAKKIYEKSAQIVDILGRGTTSIVWKFDLNNFIYKHLK